MTFAAVSILDLLGIEFNVDKIGKLSIIAILADSSQAGAEVRSVRLAPYDRLHSLFQYLSNSFLVDIEVAISRHYGYLGNNTSRIEATFKMKGFKCRSSHGY